MQLVEWFWFRANCCLEWELWREERITLYAFCVYPGRCRCARLLFGICLEALLESYRPRIVTVRVTLIRCPLAREISRPDLETAHGTFISRSCRQKVPGALPSAKKDLIVRCMYSGTRRSRSLHSPTLGLARLIPILILSVSPALVQCL